MGTRRFYNTVERTLHMSLLMPEYLFKGITHISVDFLRKNDIRGLVLDVDNTLTGHGSQTLRPDIALWLEDMKAAGIKLIIASNNFEKRVAPFADKIGVDHLSFCCKPLPCFAPIAAKRMGLSRRHIALVGDQIFTDRLGGSIAGIPVLMVRPMAKDTQLGVRIKRKFEAPIFLRYYQQGGKLL